MQTQPPVVFWRKPDEVPDVELGTEEYFWIAVQSSRGRSGNPEVHTMLAIYQNRPLLGDTDEDGDYSGNDWELITPDGDPHHSVGWVTNKKHNDFDDFYERIDFSESYQLLGWAEYVPPVWEVPSV